MSLDASLPQQPDAGEQIPLTRKELRERERAAERSATERSATEQTVADSPALVDPAHVNIEAVLPTRRSQRDSVAKPANATAQPRARKVPRSAVKSKRIRVSPAAFTTSGSPRRRGKALASKAFSFVTMLFAGALLIGVSVPANAFLGSDNVATIAAPLSEAAVLSTDSGSAQSLAVSDQVVGKVAEHDSLDVISYAEVLALKHAGVSYEYRATAGAIRWPFPYEIPITDGFGERWGGFHKGTDFAAAEGTPIYAIANGVVSYIESDHTGYGYNAIISHVINGQQVQTQYAHMVTNSSPLVVGDPIRVGDFVGLVGQTGRSYGAHLHLEIHLDKVPVDPYAWLTTNAVN